MIRLRVIERPNAGDQITWVALQFWLGAQRNKGGRGQRNREEFGAGATIFFLGGRGAALPLSSAPGKTAMLRRLVIKLCSVHSIHSY